MESEDSSVAAEVAEFAVCEAGENYSAVATEELNSSIFGI